MRIPPAGEGIVGLHGQLLTATSFRFRAVLDAGLPLKDILAPTLPGLALETLPVSISK